MIKMWLFLVAGDKIVCFIVYLLQDKKICVLLFNFLLRLKYSIVDNLFNSGMDI